MPKQKQKVIVVLTAVLITAVLSVVLYKVNVTDRQMPEITINGKAVSEEEYLRCMEALKYDVTVYFYENYQAESESPRFWETRLKEEVPAEKLTESVLEQLSYIYAAYAVAKENGYTDTDNYKELKKRFEEENQERREKIENGEVVYGLSEYPFELWLEYELSAFKERYVQEQNNEGMTLSEEEIQKYYKTENWLVDGDSNPDLETVRPYIEKQLRERRYEEILEARKTDSVVNYDKESLYRFTLQILQK